MVAGGAVGLTDGALVDSGSKGSLSITVLSGSQSSTGASETGGGGGVPAGGVAGSTTFVVVVDLTAGVGAGGSGIATVGVVTVVVGVVVGFVVMGARDGTSTSYVQLVSFQLTL